MFCVRPAIKIAQTVLLYCRICLSKLKIETSYKRLCFMKLRDSFISNMSRKLVKNKLCILTTVNCNLINEGIYWKLQTSAFEVGGRQLRQS